jgi:hypothetical protein
MFLLLENNSWETKNFFLEIRKFCRTFSWNKKNILDKKILLTDGTKLEKFSHQEFCSNQD